jgi:hypothetical protein
MADGQIRGRFAPRRSERFGLARLALVGPEPNLDRGGRKAYKRAAEADHEPSRSEKSARPGPAGLRRAAESSWLAGSPDDRINDRPPGIFLWVEDTREPGLRVVRTAERPSPHGAVFIARGRDMGREINLEADNRLNLRDAVALSHSYFLMLKAAFEQRLGQVGGVAVMLDSVVEIATEAGYKGTVDQAGGILKVEGGLIVEPSPSGRLTVRRADSPTP